MTRNKLIGITLDTVYTKKNSLEKNFIYTKYYKAILDTTNATPVLIPVDIDKKRLISFINICDGFLITGAESNIHPLNYSNKKPYKGCNLDTKRDKTNLTLIKAIIKNEKPFLSICRGFQEVNVALGGTLFQKSYKINGRFDHREKSKTDKKIAYGLSHSIKIIKGGILYNIIKKKKCRS